MGASNAPSVGTPVKRPSIKDVAQRAGVSWKTVSNVVHERDVVRPQTAARVKAAIEELGYVPNQLGRDLRGTPRRVIALVLPDLVNPYFSRLAQATQEAARKRGYTVTVELTLESPQIEKEFITGRSRRPVDAVILSPSAMADEELAHPQAGSPLVLLGESLLAGPDAVHVAIDNVASAADAVAHLASHGRSRIAFLGSQDLNVAHSTSGERLLGYRRALDSLGLAADSSLELTVDRWDREDGLAAVSAALDRGLEFDAVLAANDLLGIGAMSALRRHGVRIPDGVAVIGWDDIPECEYSAPPMSSIAPDLERLVNDALDAAIGPLKGGPSSSASVGREIIVPHVLRVRESSGSSRVSDHL